LSKLYFGFKEHEEKKEDFSISVKTDGKIRYTVPRNINKSGEVTVYFRVADVYKNVRVQAYSGDKLVYDKKKLKVAPGEMESVKINVDLCDKEKDLQFRLEV
jgi:hypothetical protein